MKMACIINSQLKCGSQSWSYNRIRLLAEKCPNLQVWLALQQQYACAAPCHRHSPDFFEQLSKCSQRYNTWLWATRLHHYCQRSAPVTARILRSKGNPAASLYVFPALQGDQRNTTNGRLWAARVDHASCFVKGQIVKKLVFRGRCIMWCGRTLPTLETAKNTFLSNVGTYLPDYTVSRATRQKYSSSTLYKSQILHSKAQADSREPRSRPLTDLFRSQVPERSVSIDFCANRNGVHIWSTTLFQTLFTLSKEMYQLDANNFTMILFS